MILIHRLSKVCSFFSWGKYRFGDLKVVRKIGNLYMSIAIASFDWRVRVRVRVTQLYPPARAVEL
jgi:hypothetical protein